MLPTKCVGTQKSRFGHPDRMALRMTTNTKSKAEAKQKPLQRLLD